MGGKPIIDYKGFIKLVALLAHIGMVVLFFFE